MDSRKKGAVPSPSSRCSRVGFFLKETHIHGDFFERRGPERYAGVKNQSRFVKYTGELVFMR